MDIYEFEKYTTTKENLKQTLEEYGVAIIPCVLTQKECDDMLDGMWSYLEHITQKWDVPINRNKKKTWGEIYRLYPLHSMMIQHWGIGHNQASWDLRQNPKIIDIFAHLWSCEREDLLVSFDGASFGMPPEVTGKGWTRNKTWLHTDQSFTRNNFECIQSWVTAQDVNEGDGTLFVMEQSHKYHQECAQKFGLTEKRDWYQLNQAEEQFYVDKGCKYKKIKCPRGSMVFWDSRTIHCGVEPLRERQTQNLRVVSYLCYMKKELCDEDEIENKRNAYYKMITTSHYPCKIVYFPKFPSTHGRGEYGHTLPQITEINRPVLTDLGLSLAGIC